MTADELLSVCLDGACDIICDTPEQRVEALRILSGYGIPCGSCWYSNWTLSLIVSCGINYLKNPFEAPLKISFKEFSSILNTPASAEEIKEVEPSDG